MRLVHSCCAVLCLVVLVVACDDKSARELGEESDEDLVDPGDDAPDDANRPDDDALDSAQPPDLVADTDDTDALADGDADVTLPPSSFDTLFVAETSLEVPWFLPISPGGTVGVARRLAPERAAGFQLGEATLQFVLPSPQTQRMVVGLRLRSGEVALFSLGVDGGEAVAPVPLGTAVAWRSETTFSDDGRVLVYVDESSLYAVPIDGSASAPTRLATLTDPGVQPRRPRWVEASGRVAFELERGAAGGQVSASLGSAALDGSQADAPLALTPPDASQQRIQAVLPDGRLLYHHGDPLFALPADGSGTPLRLTPLELTAALEAVLDGGERVLVELRDVPIGPRDLVAVATDGSSADAPTLLLDEVSSFDGLLTADGALVFRRTEANGTSTVHELAPLDGTGTPRQLATAFASAPYLAALTPDDQAVIGCDDANAIVRIERSGTAATPAIALAQTPGVPCGFVGLTAGGTQVVLRSVDDAQWSVFQVVAADGSGAAVTLEAGTGLVEALPEGVLWRQTTAFSGLMVRMARGEVYGPIEGWLEGTLGAAHLVTEPFPPLALLRVDGAAGSRWHAISPFQLENASWPVSEPGLGGSVVALHGNHALLAVPEPGGTRLVALDLYGGTRVSRELVARVGGPWAFVASRGEVVHADAAGGVLEAVRLDDGTRVRLMNTPPGSVLALDYDAANDRVVLVLADWTAPSMRLVAVAADGSAPDSPLELASFETLGDLGPTGVEVVGERALVTLSTMTTAVPHPTAIATVRLDGSDAGLEPPLLLSDPGTHVLWHSPHSVLPPSPDPPPAASHTRDDAWVAVMADGHLVGVRPDGSEQVPVLSSGEWWPEPLHGVPWLAPDDRTLLAAYGSDLMVGAIDGSSPQRWVGPRPGTHLVISRDSRMAYLHGAARDGRLGLWALPLDGSRSDTSSPDVLEDAVESLALAPDDALVVFTCDGPDDRRLCGWLPGSEPVQLTGADDTVERVLGFVEWP